MGFNLNIPAKSFVVNNFCILWPTLAISTSFRWRHRFLAGINTGTDKLKGIVEADETWFLESRKGDRVWTRAAKGKPSAEMPVRKARKRGGKATKRGLSDEQVPVLVAADRSGTTFSTVLPKVNANTLQKALAPVIDKDALLVTDGNNRYPLCATALGVSHEALNQSSGECVRGEFHIQNVNNSHSRLKKFIERRYEIATKYSPVIYVGIILSFRKSIQLRDSASPGLWNDEQQYDSRTTVQRQR